MQEDDGDGNDGDYDHGDSDDDRKYAIRFLKKVKDLSQLVMTECHERHTQLRKVLNHISNRESEA